MTRGEGRGARDELQGRGPRAKGRGTDGEAGPREGAPSGEPREPREPLVIRSIDYLGPMATPTGWRPEAGLPEIAFAGRSNVGKSSLLNSLVRRKKLARVSNTPGRTREIHFFDVNHELALVDLPGYGYARISRERRAEWRPLIEGYLKASPALRGLVQLLDARHDPTKDDRQMIDFLAELGVPTIFVLTKVDKLSRTQVSERVREIARLLELEEEHIIPFSSVTGTGRHELLEAIVALVSQPSWRSA